MSRLLSRITGENLTGRVAPAHATDNEGGRPLLACTVHRAALLGVVCAIATVAGIFAFTPDGTGLLQAFDTSISLAAHTGSWRSTSLTRATASAAVILITGASACGWLWRRRGDARASRQPLVATAIAGVVAWLPAEVVRRPGPGSLGDLSAANSATFPSVPAAMITALALMTMARAEPRRRPIVVAATMGVAGLVLAVPVLTGAFSPIDVAAGSAIGACIAVVLDAPRRGDRPKRRAATRRPFVLLIATALLLSMLPVGLSYVRALRLPGNATVDQRTVDWLRTHRLGPFVDRAESWWLWRHLPSSSATIDVLPGQPSAAAAGTAGLPVRVPAAVTPALSHEGEWTVTSADQRGVPRLATTSFRPDPAHPSVVAGAAWINATTTRFTLIAGTQQPGGGAGPAGAHVPAAFLASLLAVFNSGYKMADTSGGALIEGRSTRTMVEGLATLAIRPDGSATVGAWGSDLPTGGSYLGLRQNLHLLVHDGTPVPGVSTNAGGRWGTVRNTLPTWRSGVGVLPDGNLVYVAGNNLTLGVLAETLVRLGTTQAMELDIHRGMVAFNWFSHDPALRAHKLLPEISGSATRYLTVDWRDFIVVTYR